ncbi:SpoIIE family protein phosphatase [Actinotalea sp. K2]|uniref:SpoIIE family protein phosphatase n=1 Tax=Actinotalea sp. K2 TaxID=2939438 RepID=UPI002017C0B2|nr:SpoIIE family protein phosphatase [Actinotalea sp. K2]MCL3860742.1 SpoIIE family protein phosphatase [Actinotalea sp. K2]
MEDLTAMIEGRPRVPSTSSGERVSAAMPAAMADQPAATLLVNLEQRTVVYANRLAVELGPGIELPVPLAQWSRAAGLRTPDGTLLEDGPDLLEAIAAGSPERGLQISAARASDTSAAGEALWAVGMPLTDAPAPLADQALVILLPMRQQETVRALQDISGDLHARAATASELSFTISDPHRPDDPLVWVNPAFEQVTGYRAEDVLGRNCRFLQGPDTDRSTVDRLGAAIRAGTTVAETVLNYRKDGTPFWNQLVISPVVDGSGQVTHHVGIQTDVTVQVEAQRARDAALDDALASEGRLQLLAEVGQSLIQHLDYTLSIRTLADLTVPALATWGFVAVTSDTGRFDRLHVAARDPERVQDALDLENQDISWLTRSPSVAAALAGTPSHGPRPFAVDIDGLPSRTTPEQLTLLGRLGLGSALVVPLRARDRVLGVLCLVHADPDGFTAQDVATAIEVGQQAGLGLDNLRLYLRERDAAVTLQRSLLPTLPDIPGLDVDATYLPAARRAEVGGDWFDVLPLPDGVTGLAVGDVVGHDLRAAASMGQLRSVLRSYAWSGESAGRVVSRLDELVRGLDMADIATCIYLRLDRDRLSYSRAGHPPALLRLPGGEVRSLDGALTTPVGVSTLGDAAPEAEAELPHGGVLVVYTDGLVERRDRPLRAGIAALTQALSRVPDGASAAQVGERLISTLVSESPEDDVCLLVVRRT